jgi:Copper transport outer membrane protein, MctB
VIDFRYHLVSIIAVFLALAVGLAVGSTALSGKAEEALTAAQHRALADNNSLRKDDKLLQQEVAADQAIATANSKTILDGLLQNEKVVLIAAPGADTAVLSGLSTALRQADATVTGEVQLNNSFTTTSGQTEDALSELARSLAAQAGLALAPDPEDEVAGQQAAAQVLADSLVSSSGTETSSSSQNIVNDFSQAGYITVVSGNPAAAPAQVAVLVTPNGPPPQSASQVLVAFAQELKSAGGATVMAGAVVSIGTGSAISAEDSTGPLVSTVDDADTESGQILVVDALVEALHGKSPKPYGAGSGTAVNPAPTASPTASPTSRPSTSPTVSSH